VIHEYLIVTLSIDRVKIFYPELLMFILLSFLLSISFSCIQGSITQKNFVPLEEAPIDEHHPTTENLAQPLLSTLLSSQLPPLPELKLPEIPILQLPPLQ
jgi:hypothetical protein